MKVIPGIVGTDLGYPYNLHKIRHLLIAHMCFPEDENLRRFYVQATLRELARDHVLHNMSEGSINYGMTQRLDGEVRAANKFFGGLTSPVIGSIDQPSLMVFHQQIQHQLQKEFPLVARVVYKFIQIQKFHPEIKGGASLEKVIGLLDSAISGEKGVVKNSKYMKTIWRKYKQVAHLIFAYIITESNDGYIHPSHQDINFIYRAVLAQEFLMSLKVHGGKLYQNEEKMWLLPRLKATGSLSQLKIDDIFPPNSSETQWLANYKNDSRGFNKARS